MRRYVVDASVAVKWFVPEIHSAEALRLLSLYCELLAPDLLPSEFGNILWKKTRRGEIRVPEAVETFHALAGRFSQNLPDRLGAADRAAPTARPSLTE
jgi:predicted nucleic acid-binding protein